MKIIFDGNQPYYKDTYNEEIIGNESIIMFPKKTIQRMYRKLLMNLKFIPVKKLEREV